MAIPGSGGEGAVVGSGVEPRHRHPVLDQFDRRFEEMVEVLVRQQVVRGVVRRRDQQDASGENGLEGPGEEHRVTGIVNVQFVEAEHTGVPEHVVQGLVDGRFAAVNLLFGAVGPGMEFPEEIVEVHSTLAVGMQGTMEQVQEP